MTKRETYCTVRGLKVWATAGMMLILVLSSGPALAAQIDITNCTSTKVAICSFDNMDGSLTTKQKHILDGGGTDTEHFTCHSNCYFAIATRNTDDSCTYPKNVGGYPIATTTNVLTSPPYYKLDHSWGKGDYLLVSLDQTSSKQYKSADLTKGSTCP